MRLAKWIWLLNKRLYKKLSFVLLLLVIPVCIAAFTMSVQGDSGFLHIILSAEDDDPKAAEIVEGFLTEDSLIRFTYLENPQEAIKKVEMGQADGAWIFLEDFTELVEDFSAPKSDREPLVRVVEREESIFLRISHEKLTATLFKYTAPAYFIQYFRATIEGAENLTDEELEGYFMQVPINRELFVFREPAGEKAEQDTGYLTMPIRGLMSVLVVVCAMAAALYFLRDEELGTFCHVPQRRRLAVAFGCILIAALNMAATVYLALWISGLMVSPGMEAAALLLLSLSAAAFALVVMVLLRSIRIYSALIPMMAVALVVVCPVFFNFRSIGPVQHLFPPTYYINASFDIRYLLGLAAYAVLGLLLAWVLEWLGKRKLR